MPGGYIWFTETGGSAIGRIDPATGAYLATSPRRPPICGPGDGLRPGERPCLLHRQRLAGKIGYFNPATITPSAGITESDAVPTFGVAGSPLPNGITYDPADGDLWFVDQGTNQIGMFDPATNSFNATAYNLPNASANPRPTSIALGSDGNLWFNDDATGQIDMFNPTTGNFAANGPWSLPSADANSGAAIMGVTAGPDGDIYFTVQGKGQVGWFNPSLLTATSNSNTNSVIGFADVPNGSARCHTGLHGHRGRPGRQRVVHGDQRGDGRRSDRRGRPGHPSRDHGPAVHRHRGQRIRPDRPGHL